MSQKMLIVLAMTIVALHLSQNVAGLTPSKTLLVKTKDGAEIGRLEPRCEIGLGILDCEANDGHCVDGPGLRPRCICNNGSTNYPFCKDSQPEFIECPYYAECAHTEGMI